MKYEQNVNVKVHKIDKNYLQKTNKHIKITKKGVETMKNMYYIEFTKTIK